MELISGKGQSKWQPRKLDVEKFIVSTDSDNNILALFLKNQEILFLFKYLSL